MKSTTITNQILNIVRNIEKEQNRENRYDRIKALERENEFLKGNQEQHNQRMKALENYLGVEFIKESKYQKKHV